MPEGVFVACYSCFSSEYKRPIATDWLRFKDGTAMQWQLHPSRIPSTRPEVATIIERLTSRQPPSSAATEVCARWFAFLTYRRKQKWIWALLAFLLAFESYFVREMLAALFFFAIVYVLLVALVALYLLYDHVVSCGVLWVASLGRSFYFWLHHHVAGVTRVPRLPKSRAFRQWSEDGARIVPR